MLNQISRVCCLESTNHGLKVVSIIKGELSVIFRIIFIIAISPSTICIQALKITGVVRNKKINIQTKIK